MTTSASAAEAHFQRRRPPRFMRMFMEDFDASEHDTAAVFGNGGYERLGLSKLQEVKPAVAGSRGGWGWFQWTGPRRRNFEAYCKPHGFDPSSDEANYKFLCVELTGSGRNWPMPACASMRARARMPPARISAGCDATGWHGMALPPKLAGQCWRRSSSCAAPSSPPVW